MGIATHIEEWIFPEGKSFNMIAFNKFSDYAPIHHADRYLSDIVETEEYTSTRNGLTFVHVQPGQAVLCESLLLNPIDSWDRIKEIQKHYAKYKANAGITGVEFRVLVHLKYRGDVGGNKMLLSDRTNKSDTMLCLIPSLHIDNFILKNQNMVFEFELDDNGIRNYFYNSSTRTFVHNGKPSWTIDRANVRPAG